MITVLCWIAGIFLFFQALIGLSFSISSIWEKERRASIFGSLQFFVMLAMLILFFYLFGAGFFHTTPGTIVLILGLVFGALGAASLVLRLGVNAQALEGTKGSTVGQVRRQDEREIMFARNRSLPAGSEQYQRFYESHPEYEEYDAARRAKG
ncbi:MAG: hypothetical protein KJO34_19910, partial [Deltaproteobacteria bacterium]|nr:hypothetical protein [Deltaproteobacteria bacterium]